MQKRSWIAVLAGLVGGLALLAAAVGALGASTGVLSPLGGFRLFRYAVVPGAPLALVLGLIGVWHTRESSGNEGRALAWLGAIDGLVLLGIAVAAIGSNGGAPLIHDVTTDIEDPPFYRKATANAEDRVNGVVYPDGGPEVPKLQREHYPDIQPIVVKLDHRDAYEVAKEAVDALGWTVTLARKSGGIIEASDTSAVFRFVDDVVIRITEVRYDESIIDIRSNSRVGRGDLGANAARIRAFRDKVLELAQARPAPR